MTITVRLAREQERLLKEAAKQLSASRSSLVREAIVEYCQKELKKTARSPYEAVAGKIGVGRGGGRDLSSAAHALFKKALHERRTRPR